MGAIIFSLRYSPEEPSRPRPEATRSDGQTGRSDNAVILGGNVGNRQNT